MGKCFESILERVQYMAGVAKIQAMKTTLLQAAEEIESLRNQLADEKLCHAETKEQLAAVPDIRVQEAALVGEIMILKSQLAECQKDAARYRWLKDFPWNGTKHPAVWYALTTSQEDMDAAIDSAMGEQHGKV